jgi:GT2 family glycosyltransferase
MDAERWIADQRFLREALRALRRTPDGRHPVEPAQPVGSPGTAQLGAPIVSERGASENSQTTPLASVIVVCWNAANVLGRCLDQLLAQDYANYEIIVVDDGSEDNTLEVAEGASAHGDVTIVRSPLNHGCSHARNLGMQGAKGEIIAFIDADGFAAPNWLGQIVDTFAADASIGGVASTVFFARNPLVVNGAGGIVNRQGWAADVSMNESYEWAEIVSEALYPMGCGMAVRRSVAEQVGPFDDRMLNYYDDVDYGVRLWRAGYRVVVAPDAWIDHGFGGDGGDSSRKRLLCERHRMRVVLKHAPVRRIGTWAVHEARGVLRASGSLRRLKLSAMLWNVRHLRSTLASRAASRRSGAMPDHLIDPSWGDAFPAGLAELTTPRPEALGATLEMADPHSSDHLVYGWFPRESVDGRTHRWAAAHAAALVRLVKPARWLVVDFVHPPADTGGVRIEVRRLDRSSRPTCVWDAHLAWQYVARSVESHPVEIPAGDYELNFSAIRGWSDPPRDTRVLGLALTRLAFTDAYDVAGPRLDMASAETERQLLYGWFGAEAQDGKSYRWSTRRSAAIVRAPARVQALSIECRMPPERIGCVEVGVRDAAGGGMLFSTTLHWEGDSWHEQRLPVSLQEGDYVVSFDAESTWSNPGQRDPTLPPENRSLGLAVSSLEFDIAADR